MSMNGKNFRYGVFIKKNYLLQVASYCLFGEQPWQQLYTFTEKIETNSLQTVDSTRMIHEDVVYFLLKTDEMSTKIE